MITAEHQLVVEMFKQQRLFYVGLIKLLQSREIVSEGDLHAFDALAVAERESVESGVKEEYLRAAKTLGVILDDSQLI